MMWSERNSNPPRERMPRSGTLQNIKGLSPSAALRITRAESRIFSRQDLEFDADEEDMMSEPPSPTKNNRDVGRRDVPSRKPVPSSVPSPVASPRLGPLRLSSGSSKTGGVAGSSRSGGISNVSRNAGGGGVKSGSMLDPNNSSGRQGKSGGMSVSNNNSSSSIIGARQPSWQNIKRNSRPAARTSKAEANFIAIKRREQDQLIRDIDARLAVPEPDLTYFDEDFGVKAPTSAANVVLPLKLTGRPAPYSPAEPVEFAPFDEEEETGEMEAVTIAFNEAMRVIEDSHTAKSKQIMDYVNELEKKVNNYEDMLKRVEGNLCMNCACGMGVERVILQQPEPIYKSESEDEETKAFEKYVNYNEANNPNWGKVDRNAKINHISSAPLKQLISYTSTLTSLSHSLITKKAENERKAKKVEEKRADEKAAGRK